MRKELAKRRTKRRRSSRRDANDKDRKEKAETEVNALVAKTFHEQRPKAFTLNFRGTMAFVSRVRN